MNETELYEKIKKLEEENTELKNKLKTYTAPIRNKNYYENHKEDIIGV
jgi:molecular chaperone GrpE (heat shock protein)